MACWCSLQCFQSFYFYFYILVWTAGTLFLHDLLGGGYYGQRGRKTWPNNRAGREARIRVNLITSKQQVKESFTQFYYWVKCQLKPLCCEILVCFDRALRTVGRILITLVSGCQPYFVQCRYRYCMGQWAGKTPTWCVEGGLVVNSREGNRYEQINRHNCHVLLDVINTPHFTQK